MQRYMQFRLNCYEARVVTGVWLHLPSFLCSSKSEVSGTKVSNVIISEARGYKSNTLSDDKANVLLAVTCGLYV